MELETLLTNTIKILIGGLAFVLTFYTTADLMVFFGGARGKIYIYEDYWLTISWGLLIDMSLLSLFALTHSVLAKLRVKTFAFNMGIHDCYRALYTIVTAACLLVLTRNWVKIPGTPLWDFSMTYTPCWWISKVIHGLAWMTVYVGNVCMDVNEIVGVKQIYYSVRGLPDPNYRKSYNYQRLSSHIRHPSFLCFTLIFWTTPIMSLDRLLLATIMTLYMYIAWNPDQNDYAYQYKQYIKKFYELERLES